MSFVFTSQDVNLRFVDGGRDGEKTSFEMKMAGSDLLLQEKSGPVFHKNRGVFDHRRAAELVPVDGQLSWRYANADISEWIRQNLSGVSTTASSGNLCDHPNDYSDSSWTKVDVSISSDGIAPDGVSTAQRITPTATSGYISYTASFTPMLNERVYVDVWGKAATDHDAEVSVSVSYHGSGVPPTAWNLPWSVNSGWEKHTAGNRYQSDYVTEETVTVKITPDVAGLNSIDLWGVYIRREVTENKTWDLYIDVNKGGSVDHTLVVEGVAYKTMNFEEGEEASIYAIQFDSTGSWFMEV